MVDERWRDKKSNMQMVEEGQKIKCEISTGLFSQRERHILGLCDWRTCHSRRDILDASRKFCRKIIGRAGFCIGCHSISQPSISRLRVTSHVLWQNLHAFYPS
jgi:hypothetical protein